uniref:zinc finger protein BALDIBIS-like isoform X2 n=1 Tax=Erigeron canadensis TaxID=72917 RepID=UPI001CB8E375|nr:zinc finger protein BALDIBIS-like isoform X2 [Erigeron canadensis]
MMSSDHGFDPSSSPSSLSTFNIHEDPSILISNPNPNNHNNLSSKRKRNLPGNPDAEVVALSPKSLMATNRFLCEICNKGFQRDQNLQLHRRGHNLPWKLKQRNKNEVVKKKVYICPEKSCVHHDPSRALGDLTGVKKHFSRKHGEKKWKCEKCQKKYAVQSDWKAHSKICGTREYKCDCGTLFSRKDSFITHRAFCDALSEENSRMAAFPMMSTNAAQNLNFRHDLMMMNNGLRFPGMFGGGMLETSGSNQLDDHVNNNVGKQRILPMMNWLDQNINNASTSHSQLMENPSNSPLFGSSSLSNNNISGMLSSSSEMVQWFNGSSQQDNHHVAATYSGLQLKEEQDNNNNKAGDDEMQLFNSSMYNNYTTCTTPLLQPIPPPAHMSATALLQKAAQMGSTTTNNRGHGDAFGLMMSSSSLSNEDGGLMMIMSSKESTQDSSLTRDFLGVGGNDNRRPPFNNNNNNNIFKFTSTTSMDNSTI